MGNQIRIGIMGHGNLGRGVELALGQNEDMALVAIFTRRDPALVKPLTTGARVLPDGAAQGMAAEIDVLILCGGSATDLPEMGPEAARLFHTVDSFDTHARIPEYFGAVDAAACASGHVSIISAGWDPGLFSINRAYGEAILPRGDTNTFWGRGVSQGHSDAIRRVPGVKNAIQYTVPLQAAVEAVRGGGAPDLTPRQKHLRECFVVAEEGADKEAIVEAIKTIPNYFADYDTTVTFLTEEALKADHGKMPHGGFLIRGGKTGGSSSQVIEYSLQMESNPEFTSSILVCCARAVHRMAQRGERGAKTMLDIPPAMLCAADPADLRKRLL